MTFPIRRVERRQAQQVEQQGSKPKFWFRDGDRRLLFKADDRETGEDWAEVVACHLCRLLGLPHVDYELAAEYDGDQYVRPGVVCENMSPPPRALVLGNQLLMTVVPDYPGAQKFKVKQHTVDAACDVVELLESPPAEWMSFIPADISTALDVFVGYVLLDAWSANQDRHHENWGAIGEGTDRLRLFLAPTFDHGSGLARNLLDSEREERLTTRDKNRSLDSFSARGRSCFYDSVAEPKPLLLLDAFRKFAIRDPGAATVWLERLRTVTRDDVSAILDLVPAERMSAVCKRFTLELLEINRQRLLCVEVEE